MANERREAVLRRVERSQFRRKRRDVSFYVGQLEGCRDSCRQALAEVVAAKASGDPARLVAAVHEAEQLVAVIDGFPWKVPK